MSSENIAPKVAQFVVEHIHSVEQLETLLLLHADKSREWSAEDVAAELRTSIDAAKKRLSELKHIPAVEENTSTRKFRFQVSNDAMLLKVEELVQEYSKRRVSIISLIYCKPASELRAFSDAFRITKKEDN